MNDYGIDILSIEGTRALYCIILWLVISIALPAALIGYIASIYETFKKVPDETRE